tara:strand:+ start:2739 stop:2849 length:111 start_codon:yes stop_codon:yes gene_type:complete
MDFLSEIDYEREEDWFSDRKGGYEISYEILKPKDNE